ncbi:hypothetical protein GTQ34_02730 [Muricauda sp. JGD-17]|uniref:TonB-dependent receptor n=1 Tax=Flagellimonas ochracea TaxID=2696472 RepID=A0A964T9P9_9FLAO|nr:hypothetical protein [Allomuricauda ochracea]NAY90822.1 hypothetical protein [Allomuricauda ochracea]
MKKIKIAIAFGVSLVLGLNAQNSASGSFKNMPQEAVYLQHNESLVFSGENLLYKFYCLDKATKSLSQISKIGYVSLINKEGDIIFSHKLNLQSGKGSGDFFVPTSIPTGSYKLLGYSEWMKNIPQEHFFQSDVYIVNPYQPVPAVYLEEPKDSLDTIVPAAPKKPIASNVPAQKESVHLKLSLDNDVVGKREMVTVVVNGKNEPASAGNYSISVRKVDSLPSPSQMSSEAFVDKYLNRVLTAKRNGTIELPELRGDMISGTITSKETGLPVENQRISLSLPGDDFLFNVATSNGQGRFQFIIAREYDNTTAALQILSEEWDSFDVELDDENNEYDSFSFSDFKLSKEMQQRILEKSIQNQIENAYREVKLDSVVPASHSLPFYRKFTAMYDFDDYTRFNSIPETIVEVVDQVGVRRLDDGTRIFEVRPEEGFADRGLLPMVFVDGLFIRRHEDIMDYSAKKIKTISFSREKVLLGSQMFQGVISFKTIEGNFYSDFYTPHIVNVDLFKPESEKVYYNQDYSENQNQRVPDFRHQLFWEPNLDLSSGSKEVIFYTSDVPGTYELVLEGFTSTGNPVSVKERLVVE